MKYLLDSAAMKKIDEYSIKTTGIPSVVLMERAALSVSSFVEKLAYNKKDSEKKDISICVVCTKGNNGADGLAAIRQLYLHGYKTLVYEAGRKEPGTDEYELQKNIIKNLEIPFECAVQDNILPLDEYDFIIDAMFGIGLSRDVTGVYAQLIDEINRVSAVKVAVDIPSGLSAGIVQVSNKKVKADYTVTFGFDKTGMVLYPGRKYAGKVIVSDIGFAVGQDNVQKILENNPARMIEKKDILTIPEREADSNKGTSGKVLIAAGSRSMGGAAFMSAQSAYRSGCGLVRVFTHENNKNALLTLVPESICDTYNDKNSNCDELTKWCTWADCIIAGPGLSVSGQSEEIVKCILQSGSDATLILDADALNIISENEEYYEYISRYKGKVIMTPHVGEMSRLTGKSIGQIKENPVETASCYSKEHGVICVLKDAATVVCDHDNVYINTSGNCGMATGGSGDVLTGVIAGMMCAGFDDECFAAALAVYIHGCAGDMCRKNQGTFSMKAWDIAESLSTVFTQNNTDYN